MNNSIVKYIGIALGLFLLQTLILNKINLFGYANPYVFPLFIILLPFTVPRGALLLLAFCYGLLIDMFNGTMGMHAFALVLMAFIRPIFLTYFQSKNDKHQFPSLNNNGFYWLLIYVSVLLFVHHLAYFWIEIANFSAVAHRMVLIFFSAISSIFISFLLLYLFKRSKK